MDWHPPGQSFGDFSPAAPSYYDHYDHQHHQPTYRPRSPPLSPNSQRKSYLRDYTPDKPLAPGSITAPISKHSVAPNQAVETLGLPTPRSSADLVKPSPPVSFQDILLKLQPVLRGEMRAITIKNVTPEIFKQCQTEGLPGWEDLRYDIFQVLQFSYVNSCHLRIDFSTDTLIVNYPSAGHEIISDVFDELRAQGLSYDREFICDSGTADVHLTDGCKSPDYSLYNTVAFQNSESPRDSARRTSSPTVVWEVAYSESSRKLARDAARLICGSQGEVLLAIALNIEHLPNRKLKSVTCAFWEMDDVAYLNATPSNLNVLEQCDDNETFGPGTRYSMISVVPEFQRVMKFTAAQTEFFQMSVLLPLHCLFSLPLIDISESTY